MFFSLTIVDLHITRTEIFLARYGALFSRYNTRVLLPSAIPLPLFITGTCTVYTYGQSSVFTLIEFFTDVCNVISFQILINNV